MARAWKGRTLGSIRHRDISTFLMDRAAKECSPSTVRRYFSTIHAFFSWCVDNDYIEAMPVKRRRLLLPSENEPRTRRLQPREEERIRAHADAFLNDIMTAALQTCLRQGSILRLQYQHLDPTIGKHGAFRLPARLMKQRRPHIVPLTADVREICDRRRAALAPDVNVPLAFIFGRRPSGLGFRGNHAVQDRWLDATRAAGIVDLWFHDLRAESASRLFEAGAPLNLVQEFLGHTTPAMTQRYLRARLGALDDAVARLEAFLVESVSEKRPGRMLKMSLQPAEDLAIVRQS
jgi:integrase